MLGETSSKKQQMNTGVRRGNTLLLTQTDRRWDRQQMDADGQAGVRRDKFEEITDENRRQERQHITCTNDTDKQTLEQITDGCRQTNRCSRRP